MIHLIRVYKDDRVIFAKALDRGEVLYNSLHQQHPGVRCRCISHMSWPDQMRQLAAEHGLGEWTSKAGSDMDFEHGRITLETIYPTPIKVKE